MKKVLLASTAIVGGALMASSPAMAGNVTSGDNYSVALGGIHRYLMGWYDYDNSTNRGRGYGFAAPFTEINVKATAQADNGIKYGVTIEIETRGDADNVADEFYAIVEGDSWGRIELGANDGAADRMNISGANAMVATGGAMSGGLGIRQFLGSTMGTVDSAGGLSRWDGAISQSGDSVKAIYFTPRFSGFQLGASLTPDDDNNGRGGLLETGNETLYEFGANYVGKFGDVGVTVAGTYQDSQENANNTLNTNQVWSVGALVTFGGFSIAGGYEDFDDAATSKTPAAGAINGGQKVYNVGVGYKMGPWGVSAGYSYGEADLQGGGDVDVSSISVGGQYAVAPGWTAMVEYATYDVDNGAGAANADRQGVMITNQFVF